MGNTHREIQSGKYKSGEYKTENNNLNMKIIKYKSEDTHRTNTKRKNTDREIQIGKYNSGATNQINTNMKYKSENTTDKKYEMQVGKCKSENTTRKIRFGEIQIGNYESGNATRKCNSEIISAKY